jgi:selenide, water dikinase
MGGSPLFGLNIVGWNEDELPLSILGDVLAGASEAASDGSWVIAGGHTIDDPEPKFGLAIIGLVDPGRILTTSGLRDGDVLVLTKAIGVGVISTAIKKDRADEGTIAAAVASMTQSNAEAARVAVASGATGATDVTGFGLLGHLRNALDASGADAQIDAAAVPLLPGARDLAADGMIPGGTRKNLDWASERIDEAPDDDLTMLLLADAQTSGGLLFGASPEEAEGAVEDLRTRGHAAAVIGRVRGGDGRISIR